MSNSIGAIFLFFFLFTISSCSNDTLDVPLWSQLSQENNKFKHPLEIKPTLNSSSAYSSFPFTSFLFPSSAYLLPSSSSYLNYLPFSTNHVAIDKNKSNFNIYLMNSTIQPSKKTDVEKNLFSLKQSIFSLSTLPSSNQFKYQTHHNLNTTYSKNTIQTKPKSLAKTRKLTSSSKLNSMSKLKKKIHEQTLDSTILELNSKHPELSPYELIKLENQKFNYDNFFNLYDQMVNSFETKQNHLEFEKEDQNLPIQQAKPYLDLGKPSYTGNDYHQPILNNFLPIKSSFIEPYELNKNLPKMNPSNSIINTFQGKIKPNYKPKYMFEAPQRTNQQTGLGELFIVLGPLVILPLLSSFALSTFSTLYVTKSLINKPSSSNLIQAKQQKSNYIQLEPQTLNKTQNQSNLFKFKSNQDNFLTLNQNHSYNHLDSTLNLTNEQLDLKFKQNSFKRTRRSLVLDELGLNNLKKLHSKSNLNWKPIQINFKLQNLFNKTKQRTIRTLKQANKLYIHRSKQIKYEQKKLNLNQTKKKSIDLIQSETQNQDSNLPFHQINSRLNTRTDSKLNIDSNLHTSNNQQEFTSTRNTFQLPSNLINFAIKDAIESNQLNKSFRSKLHLNQANPLQNINNLSSTLNLNLSKSKQTINLKPKLYQLQTKPIHNLRKNEAKSENKPTDGQQLIKRNSIVTNLFDNLVSNQTNRLKSLELNEFKNSSNLLNPFSTPLFLLDSYESKNGDQKKNSPSNLTTFEQIYLQHINNLNQAKQPKNTSIFTNQNGLLPTYLHSNLDLNSNQMQKSNQTIQSFLQLQKVNRTSKMTNHVENDAVNHLLDEEQSKQNVTNKTNSTRQFAEKDAKFFTSDFDIIQKYLHQTRPDGEYNDEIIATYLTCNGLLDQSNHCLQRLVCQYVDESVQLPELEKEVASLYIDDDFKMSMRNAAQLAYHIPGQCSNQYSCLRTKMHT